MAHEQEERKPPPMSSKSETQLPRMASGLLLASRKRSRNKEPSHRRIHSEPVNCPPQQPTDDDIMWGFGELGNEASSEWIKMIDVYDDSPASSSLRKNLGGGEDPNDGCDPSRIFDDDEDDVGLMPPEVNVGDEEKKATTNRGKYKCGRCGQVKVNHVCPFGVATTRTMHCQTENPMTAPSLSEKSQWRVVRQRPPMTTSKHDDEEDGKVGWTDRVVVAGRYTPALEDLEPMTGEEVDEESMDLDLIEAMASPPQLNSKHLAHSSRVPSMDSASTDPSTPTTPRGKRYDAVPPPPPPLSEMSPTPRPEKKIRPISMGSATATHHKKPTHRRAHSSGAIPLVRSNSASTVSAAPPSRKSKLLSTNEQQQQQQQATSAQQVAAAVAARVHQRQQLQYTQQFNPHFAAAYQQHFVQQQQRAALGQFAPHPALLIEAQQAALAQIRAADDLQRQAQHLGVLPYASAPNLCALAAMQAPGGALSHIPHFGMPPQQQLPPVHHRQQQRQQQQQQMSVAAPQMVPPQPPPVSQPQQHPQEQAREQSPEAPRATDASSPGQDDKKNVVRLSAVPSGAKSEGINGEAPTGFNLNELMTHLTTMTPQQLQEIASMSQLVLERQATSSGAAQAIGAQSGVGSDCK